MSTQTPQVPPELTDLLLEFTVNVLVEKPTDVLQYAANYFNQLLANRRENVGHQVFITVTDSVDEDDIEDEPMPNIANKYTRRKSVFAEQYNPEEDDDDETEKIVHPKTDEQRQRLGEAIKDILLFRSLDQPQMQEVLDAMFERKVETGDIVIRQDDDGDNFYVIDRGIFNIYVKNDKGENVLVGKYNNSGSFGELALMYNMPRAATIEAASEGALWAMNRQTFRRIVLKSAFKKRKEYEQLLEKVPMLKTLENYERLNLCDALMPKTFQDGDRIIKQGDEAEEMYFVEDGTVRITIVKEGCDKEVEVSRLTKGGYFGELALVAQKPRAASVYAVGTVKLATLDVQAFERLLGPCMEIMRRNVDHYHKQVIAIFGSEDNISDVR
ncbi:cAMP-dependent protein kinase type II regulatory subunit-like isoform X1 [Centruroides sculpturatus]|uniref:cAMP-dependent protein kinase type II regulatory subunit-like isoform X1 n=1 Tax=Centruroides sculpturatus TaxID=218467 RepID=UPI000C6E69D7|nr:cAMP-dependent protein kinase type II regulatory subunit-like isoform X1 [Centruroides sculpturatus]